MLTTETQAREGEFSTEGHKGPLMLVVYLMFMIQRTHLLLYKVVLLICIKG